jgi:hypothetical protein
VAGEPQANIADVQGKVDHAFDQLTGEHRDRFAAQAAEGFSSWAPELRAAAKLTAEALGLPCGKVEVAIPASLEHLPTTLLNHKARDIGSRLEAWSAAAKPDSMAQALTAEPVTYRGVTAMIAEASSVFDALRKKPVDDLGKHGVSTVIADCRQAAERLIDLHPATSTAPSDRTLRALCERVEAHVDKAEMTVNTRVAAHDNGKTIEQVLAAHAATLAPGNAGMQEFYVNMMLEEMA